MGTDPTIILKTNVKKDSDTNPYNFYMKIFHGCMVGLTNCLVLVNCLYRTKDDRYLTHEGVTCNIGKFFSHCCFAATKRKYKYKTSFIATPLVLNFILIVAKQALGSHGFGINFIT